MFLRFSSSLVLTLACTAIVSTPAGAQAPATAPAAASQQAAPSGPTLRTSTRLVVVDVIVTDKSGNPVHNLKADDFSLLESNTSQAFKSFEEHVAPSPADAAKLPAFPKLPPGIFTNFTVAPENGPLNVLLIDRLNTAANDQMYMQQEIANYLKSAPPNQRIAIFGLTDHLIMLQGFTSNPEVLKLALSKAKTKGSVLLDDAAGNGSGSLKGSDFSAENDAANGSLTPSLTTELMQQFETQNASFQTQLQGKYTLDALDLLARYLSGFPGRKNLMWFSGSFPVNVMPNPDTADSNSFLTGPFIGVASAEKQFREVTALLSRSQVAVYPIGAKGLQTSAAMSASVDQTQAQKILRNPRGGMQIAQRAEAEQRFSEHSTMYMMADDTGGKAIVDTNGLAQALKSDLENGSNYYTIAYSPSNPHLDGTFRSIKVKLKDEKYELSYRRGYFAEDTAPQPSVPGSTVPSLGSAFASNAMALALVHGAPAPTQVIFSSRVQPLGTKSEDYLAPANRPGKNPKAPYHRFGVDFAIDPRELHFTVGADGNRHETLEFVTNVYDTDGVLVVSAANVIVTNIIPAAYAQFQHSGVPYHQEVSVPEKGEYYLRLAVRDVDQNQVGAVEIPVASVRNLPPGPQPALPKPPANIDQSPTPGMGGGRHH